MPDQYRITIREIAQEAGVSQQTVSRVLNNRPDVAPGTRQRVQEIISQHGYRPSSIARGIAQGRSYLLGVVSGSLENYGPAATLMGVEEAADRLGYTLILRVIHHPDRLDIDKQLRYLIAQRVDGIVWTLPDIEQIREDLIRKIPWLKIPILFTNTTPHPDLTVIDFDNQQGGQLAAEHLLSQGYRRIGLISGPMNWLVSRQRYQGWKKGMEMAGLKVSERQIAEGDWSAVSGERAMSQLLRQMPDIEAVFASNDTMALGALKAASHVGRRIPEDLALVGYDDVPEASFFSPPLTTIRQDFKNLARLAVEMIDRQIEAGDRGRLIKESNFHLYPPQLITRQSSTNGSGPAASKNTEQL